MDYDLDNRWNWFGSTSYSRVFNKEFKNCAIYRSQEKLNEIELFFEKYAPKKDKNHFQRIEWIKTNLNDIIGLDNAFNGIDQVYHCAAKVSFS